MNFSRLNAIPFALSGNLILALFALLLSIRGVQASIVWHKRAMSEFAWKNVTIAGAILFAAAPVVFLLGYAVLELSQTLIGWQTESAEDVATAVVYMELGALHLMTRRRFPSVKIPEPATGEPGYKHLV